MIYSVDNLAILAFYNLSMYYKMESQSSLDFSTAPAPEDKGLVKDIVKKVLPVVINKVVLPALLS